MKLKKIYFILGISLIFLFFSYHIYVNAMDEKSIKMEEEIINDVFINNQPNKEYLGYLDLPKRNIKKLIKKGTDKSILDEGYVGLLDNTSIDKGNTVLAGHNTNNVFKILHKLEEKEQVFLITNSNKYVYYVIEKREIKSNDLSYFSATDEKTLTLITCTNNKNKRLMVRLKLLIMY